MSADKRSRAGRHHDAKHRLTRERLFDGFSPRSELDAQVKE
jgi:hypothetical protein